MGTGRAGEPFQIRVTFRLPPWAGPCRYPVHTTRSRSHNPGIPASPVHLLCNHTFSLQPRKVGCTMCSRKQYP